MLTLFMDTNKPINPLDEKRWQAPLASLLVELKLSRRAYHPTFFWDEHVMPEAEHTQEEISLALMTGISNYPPPIRHEASVVEFVRERSYCKNEVIDIRAGMERHLLAELSKYTTAGFDRKFDALLCGKNVFRAIRKRGARELSREHTFGPSVWEADNNGPYAVYEPWMAPGEAVAIDLRNMRLGHIGEDPIEITLTQVRGSCGLQAIGTSATRVTLAMLPVFLEAQKTIRTGNSQ